MRLSASQHRLDRLSSGRGHRPAFTLTEMLVATAISMMILLIFAQIYAAATSTVIEQRGLAQNDSRARMLSTLIRSDLQNMSYRSDPNSTSLGLLPIPDGDLINAGAQRGYFYYSENDIDDDSDDVLQFTTEINTLARSQDDHPYIGKASRIGQPSDGSTPPEDRNQPEWDDGNPGNGSSQSRAAEISYFVRNGTLYRRVLLLREPLSKPGTPYTADPSMGMNGLGGDLIPGTYEGNADRDVATPSVGDFWNDFDSSAICLWTDVNGNSVRDPAPTDTYQVRFNSLSSLDPTNPNAIGLPRFRFGFNTDTLRPVEYLPGAGHYIGRFLHEETSHANFFWPGRDPVDAQHPYKRTYPATPFNRRGVLADYQNGPRVGEDILLTNVDAFDVKIWDPGVNRFVDLGYAPASGERGYFDHRNNRRPDYGPRPVTAAVLGGDGQPGAAGVDDDGDGIVDNESEIGWPGTDDGPVNRVYDTWNPSTSIANTINPASDPTIPPYRPLLSRGFRYRGPDNNAAPPPLPAAGLPVYTEWSELPASVAEGTLLFPEDIVTSTPGNRDGHVAYIATVGGAPNTTRPSFSGIIGDNVTDGDVTWVAIDNRIGVSMIQITIRFRDVGSNLSRQLTIVHSFAGN